MIRNRPRVGRLCTLARVLGRHLLMSALVPLLPVLPTGWARGWRRWVELAEPERLRLLFEELGGSFLKLGQMLALQPDVLPREYCDALFDLLDRVPPFSAEEVERVFEQELGAPPHWLLDHFEATPIASASIGQVHVAWLQGRKLAVKVQRPTAERDFDGDSRLLDGFAGLVERFRIERLRFLVEPIREVVEWTRDELDYRREAEFLGAMGQNSTDRPHQVVPAVEASLSTRRVLTMEFLDGPSLLDYLRAVDAGDRITLRRLADIGFDAETFAIRIIENFLEQAFVDGVFHADLHPANLVILPGNRVGYIDLGITGTLGLYSRRQLAAMTLAYTRGDIDAMCRAFGGVSGAEEEALERYSQGLERLAEDWYDRSGSGLRLCKSVSMVMLDMLRLSAETRVSAQRDVIKYIRSSVATDGLISRCAPQVDVGQHLGRACRCHMAQLLGGPSRSAGGWLAGSAAGLGQLIRGGRRSVAVLDRMARGELAPFGVELVAPKSKPGPDGSMPGALGRMGELTLLLVALGLLVPSAPDLLSPSTLSPSLLSALLSALPGAAPLVLLTALALPWLRLWWRPRAPVRRLR